MDEFFGMFFGTLIGGLLGELPGRVLAGLALFVVLLLAIGYINMPVDVPTPPPLPR